jgi:hypothetical protein
MELTVLARHGSNNRIAYCADYVVVAQQRRSDASPAGGFYTWSVGCALQVGLPSVSSIELYGIGELEAARD